MVNMRGAPFHRVNIFYYLLLFHLFLTHGNSKIDIFFDPRSRGGTSKHFENSKTPVVQEFNSIFLDAWCCPWKWSFSHWKDLQTSRRKENPPGKINLWIQYKINLRISFNENFDVIFLTSKYNNKNFSTWKSFFNRIIFRSAWQAFNELSLNWMLRSVKLKEQPSA